VGGSDDADVELAGGGLADAGDLAFLQRAQELDLGGEGELAELVEEQGAAVGGLEDAFVVGDGAGERALWRGRRGWIRRAPRGWRRS
jgi:hypothetical protein